MFVWHKKNTTKDEHKSKKPRDVLKTDRNVAYVNPTMLNIMWDVNGLTQAAESVRMDEKTRSNNVLSIREKV